MKKIILSILAVVAFTLSSIAQSPQAFKYQAVARDLSGVVLSNQAVSFQISILQGSLVGPSSFTETHNVTTNDFGLVNLEIGNGTLVSGDFSTIDWGADSYFLQIEMDETGGAAFTLMGTSQLMSVPYALHATTVENESDTTHWKENGSDIYFNQGNVGIGTANPAYKLSVNGNAIEVSGVPTPGLVLNPSVGATKTGVVFQSSDQLIFGANGVANIGRIDLNAPAASFSVGSTGNVGVGTNAPTEKLHVQEGNIVVQNSTGAHIYLGSPSYSVDMQCVEATGSGSDTEFHSAGIETLRIRNTGDIYLPRSGSGVGFGYGIIMKSPDNSCWRITIDNSGNMVSTAITCP